MKLKQTGRSMIEMLGVLAIVGVLSIGGMTMYRKAILNYRLGQTQHWIEMARLITAEACANGNSAGCSPTPNAEDRSQRTKWMCAQGGKLICPYTNLRATTPLQEDHLMFHMVDTDYLYIYLRHLNKRTCEAVIDYNWNGLYEITNNTTWTSEKIQSGKKNLTDTQKEHLKSECPVQQHLILIFDLKS